MNMENLHGIICLKTVSTGPIHPMNKITELATISTGPLG